MRLIDADALMEAMRKFEKEAEDVLTCPSWWSAYNVIKEQPTVFDVEKFVKKLEEEEEYSYADFEEYAESYGLDLSEYDDWYYQGLKRAITLAKRGVKNDY